MKAAFFAVSFFLFAAAMALLFSCTPAERAVAKGAVNVASDICQELADAGDIPGYVAVECKTSDGVVQVFLPKRTWMAIKDGGK